MPDIDTRSDSLHIYLTGAANDAGAQGDSDASLGNFRSYVRSTAIKPSSSTVTLQPSGQDLIMLRAAGANGVGNGTLAAVGDNELAWTPPGGTAGTPVTLTPSDAEYKLIEGGDGEYDKSVTVQRPAALTADLSGSAQVALIETPSANANVTGMDDVSDAERAAGDVNFRCVCMKNDASVAVKAVKVLVDLLGTARTSDVTQLPAGGAGTLKTTGSFADWPVDGFAKIVTSGGAEREVVYYASRTGDELTIPAAGRGLALGDENAAAAGAADDVISPVPGISLGLEAPTSQPAGSFTDKTVAGESSAPGGVSFATPIVAGDALDVGDLAAGEIHGVWIKRVVPAGAEPGVAIEHRFSVQFDAA